MTWLAVPLLALLLVLPGGARAAVDEADLLPVDVAFALRAEARGADRIAVSWTIAKGYYLYRHRMGVAADAGFAAGELQLPPGDRHTDEFFGEVETYRDAVTAVLPGTASPGVRRVELKVKFQGCADVGVCYPPQVRTVEVAIPSGQAEGPGPLAELGRRLGLGGPPRTGLAAPAGGQALPLPPEQAFGFEAIAGGGNALLLRFTPAAGYYLYRDRTTLSLAPQDAATGVSLGAMRWPNGKRHRDEYFGETVVYFDQVDVPVELRRARGGAAEVTVSVSFQGCQDEGICYPPMARSVRVSLPAGRVAVADVSDAAGGTPGAAIAATAARLGDPAALPAATVARNAANPPTAPAGANPGRAGPAEGELLADDSRIARALSGPNRWWTLAGFFGAGLLLAFTPCVLPMIPILSGLIAGQGTRIGTRQALLLSLVYILANALVFTAAGVVAGLVGANLQVAFQTPWVITAFALLFVALALSSFGLYELQMPGFLRSRLGALTGRQRGGSLAGVAAMGALSALIVGPCVAPPLAAAVLYIGQTQDPVLGGAALFLLAMGMGLPLLAFGAAAGRGMPTSGPWMTAAQRVFGFVFLGLAVWMLSRIVPGPVALGLYGLLALAAAAWLVSAVRAPEDSRLRVVARFASLLLAVVGAAELVGALAGSKDPLQPLAGVVGGPREEGLDFRMIKSSADLDRELASAQAIGRPVMFDFYADWCVSCKEMEKYTFREPAVRDALSGFVLLKADVTANDDHDQALMRRFGIIGPPATLYFSDSTERRELRLVGFEPAAPFASRAARAATPAQAAGGP